PEALRRRKEELTKRKVEPVIVAWDGKLKGRIFEYGYHDTEIDGQETFVISAPTQAYSPLGKKTGSAPDFLPSANSRQRAWGMFVPVYALHSKRNPFAGDLTDFQNFMDWMNTYGGSVA